MKRVILLFSNLKPRRPPGGFPKLYFSLKFWLSFKKCWKNDKYSASENRCTYSLLARHTPKKSRLKFVYNELFERIVCVRQNRCIYDSFHTTMISHISCDSSWDIFGTQYFVQFCDSSKMIHEFYVWNWFKWILKKQVSENMCVGSLKVNFLGFTIV